MKKLISITTIALILSLSSVLSINAQTQDSETTDVVAEETTKEASESGKYDGIKKIISENLDNIKVAGAIDDLLNKKIGLIGKVTRITDETITIDNRKGTRIIALNEDVVISKDDKHIKTGDIAIDNWVVILGKLKDDSFAPNFIFVNTKTLRPQTQIVMLGTITSITKEEIGFLPRSGTEEQDLDITSKTVLLDLDGTEVSLSDFSEDVNAIITGFETDDGITVSTVKSLVLLSEINEE